MVGRAGDRVGYIKRERERERKREREGNDYSDDKSWILESRSVVRIAKSAPNDYSDDCVRLYSDFYSCRQNKKLPSGLSD
jgi:hypothetical protein